MLEAVVQDARSSGRLSDLRLATACLMGFAGFLRSDELINLRPCDITEMMSIKIVQSKTDQLRQGDSVVVAELINLWPCDITIDAEMMSMKIVRSKTDQLR